MAEAIMGGNGLFFWKRCDGLKVKVCGIRSLEAAQAAEQNGADYIGFIFSPRFRRFIEPEKAATICKGVKKVKKVGVFVDEDLDYVNATAELCGLDYVQLHGSEKAEYAKVVCRPVIKAWRWGDDFSVAEAEAYPSEYALVDSYTKGMVGGTGETFAWRQAAKDITRLQKPFFLAGGISAANVREAEEIFKPFAVDASGSMETDGEKSVTKIKEFLQAAKGGGA